MIQPYKPNFSDPVVETLLNILNAEYHPIELKVTPLKNAEKSDCFKIVEDNVKINGGKMILGWQIWKSNLLIEAECHAIWEDKNDNLTDITPKPPGIKSILFIEDPNLRYEGKQIDNVRINITENLLVDDFIKTHQFIYRILNLGERALEHGEILLNDEEVQDYNAILLIQSHLPLMIDEKKTRESICFCGSPANFESCHKTILDDIYDKYDEHNTTYTPLLKSRFE
jgi:hypothetical protein